MCELQEAIAQKVHKSVSALGQSEEPANER